MTNNFHFRLPDWPPQRLVREAILAANFRHLSEDTLDAETSPWPLVRGAILAYLRHLHSDFDERLRVRCEHDAKFRDELAAQVAAQAFRKYPWLRDDPRPFPQSEQDAWTLPFDDLSKSLSNLYTIRDHTLSALRDLKRQRQGNQHEIAALENGLQKINRDIERKHSFLAGPKIIKEEGKTRFFLQAHPKKEGLEPHYHFDSGKEVIPNRIQYIGFRCPQCGASVARWKQIVPLGQGYRCIIFACHCLTVAIHTPGGHGRIEPVTAEHWARFFRQSEGNDDQ